MQMKSCTIASVVLALAAIVHLMRAFLGLSLELGGRAVPIWWSVIIGILLLWLSWSVHVHTHHK